MPPRIPETQLSRARAMRGSMTLAEARLWLGLRDRRLGAKFRRQVPIGAFIADFACLEAKLIVEVDGPSHQTPQGQFMDDRRDRWFRENGWRVLRIPNDLAMAGSDLALDRIRAALDASR
jgi:very-short-patch-repair endonuclease